MTDKEHHNVATALLEHWKRRETTLMLQIKDEIENERFAGIGVFHSKLNELRRVIEKFEEVYKIVLDKPQG